jgi:hypothetical protein
MFTASLPLIIEGGTTLQIYFDLYPLLKNVAITKK